MEQDSWSENQTTGYIKQCIQRASGRGPQRIPAVHRFPLPGVRKPVTATPSAESRETGRTERYRLPDKIMQKGGFLWGRATGIENTYPKLCQLSYGTEKPYRPSAAHHQGTDHDLGRGTAETVERKRPDLAKTATGDAATPSPHRRITSFSEQQQRHLARLAERKQKGMGREYRQTVWWEHFMATGAFSANYHWGGKLILWHFH